MTTSNVSQHLVGQIQKPGQKPENVDLVVSNLSPVTNPGDWIVIYTKKGVSSTLQNEDGSSSDFLYWGLSAPYFKDDKEFNIFLQTTRLLVTVKGELARPKNHDKLDIEEIFSNG